MRARASLESPGGTAPSVAKNEMFSGGRSRVNDMSDVRQTTGDVHRLRRLVATPPPDPRGPDILDLQFWLRTSSLRPRPVINGRPLALVGLEASLQGGSRPGEPFPPVGRYLRSKYVDAALGRCHDRSSIEEMTCKERHCAESESLT